MTPAPAEVLRRAVGYLERHGVDQPRSTAELLLMRVLGVDRAGLYARRTPLAPEEARAFGRLLCRRCAGDPTQHLTGEAGFRRLVLEVGPGVFVPRPETEVLVDAAIDRIDAAGLEGPVVDVGTGSGAIALAIADERPGRRVLATERSPIAAAVARRNAARLGLAVEVLEGDLLDPLPDELRGRVALVVSNPPYLDPSEDLPREVRADPPEALFGGLGGYERLFRQARRWLGPGGGVAVELDPRSTSAIRVAAVQAGLEPLEVRRDLAGRERVLVARVP
ncbi:MAG: release factor glutamine methyltransferase [Actinomycetota bacterium]|nr:MAG: release factor glutamine methyltransferase [Actinomycetota bacterium]